MFPIKIKRKKTVIILSVIILLAVVIAVMIPVISNDPPLSVTTGTAEKMDIEESVALKGTIDGSESADVVSALNYEIISILVEEGDRVRKGQILAKLDGETLQNDYNKALQTLESSKFKYDASKLLFEEGAISKEEYLRAETAYENDKITLNSFKIAEKTRIKSPIDGTVTRVNVNLGRYASDTENKAPMFVIEDLDNLKMNVRVSEYDISKIKLGQKVKITAEVLGKESVMGTVSKISPTGESKDAASKEMVIPVQIDVEKGNTQLIAGVSAKAEILIQKKNDALTIPIDSILEDPDTGEFSVFKLNKNSIKKVPVTLGIEGDFHVEILTGDLSAKDQVVLNPNFDLKDGMEVTAVPQE